MSAASQVPGRGPTDVDDVKSDYDDYDMMNLAVL